MAAALAPAATVAVAAGLLVADEPRPPALGQPGPAQPASMASLYGVDLFGEAVRPATDGGALKQRFVIPPFSVLNARDGWWQERKRAWRAWGLTPEDGRLEELAFRQDAIDEFRDKLKRSVVPGGGGGGAWKGSKHTSTSEEYGNTGPVMGGGTSLFDPVLCECVYRWFLPGPNSAILDPFAGESTKGIVAAALGHRYVGVELRPEQVAANEAQAARMGLEAEWVQGDSAQLDTFLPPGEAYDLVWSCPPYYDLEVYGGGSKDGSTLETYPEFMRWYEAIFAACVARLRPNRFLAVTVGEVRDRGSGAYRNFVGDNITAFLRLGLHYYNELVLVTAIGSLPVRTGAIFQVSRKVGKSHQNVLVFYKGNPRGIKQAFGEVPVPDAT